MASDGESHGEIFAGGELSVLEGLTASKQVLYACNIKIWVGGQMSQNTDMAPITVRLPKVLRREAKAAAAISGEPLQDWYRKAVEDRLRQIKDPPAAE